MNGMGKETPTTRHSHNRICFRRVWVVSSDRKCVQYDFVVLSGTVFVAREELKAAMVPAELLAA